MSTHLRVVNPEDVPESKEDHGFPWRRVLIFVGIAAAGATVSFYTMRALAKIHAPPRAVQQQQALAARISNLEMLIQMMASEGA